VVFVILAGIWAAVLVPPLLRARAESRPADSIVDFRRKLRVLQRTGPSSGRSVDLGFQGSQYVEERPRNVSRPSRHPRTGHAGRGVGGSRAAPPASAAARRARTVRRRRDVMFTLLMGMGTTFVLAMVVSSTALWVFHVLMDGLFLLFVAMLARMRAIATEKEMKLRMLPQPPGQPQPAPVLLMRRSATN
jgi:hypothetical protein